MSTKFNPQPKPVKKDKKKQSFLRLKSKKQSADDRKYSRDSKKWLQGKVCAKYPSQIATQVHHMKGRQGFADEWARDRGIRLIHDKRFWLPASSHGHDWIHRNVEEAIKNGYTLTRTDILSK